MGWIAGLGRQLEATDPPARFRHAQHEFLHRQVACVAQLGLRVTPELKSQIDPECLAERKPHLEGHASATAGFHVGKPSLA